MIKNTIRDGGSTALKLVDTVDTIDNVETSYTVQTALHCLNISIYVYIYCLERLERHWNGLMHS